MEFHNFTIDEDWYVEQNELWNYIEVIMSQTTDPAAMASELRRKAERLIEAARAIEETYGLVNSIKMAEPENSRVAVDSPSSRRGPKKKDRLSELIAFLQENGPLRRGDIVERSGIPPGTIGMILKEGIFTKNDDGTWGLKKG